MLAHLGYQSTFHEVYSRRSTVRYASRPAGASVGRAASGRTRIATACRTTLVGGLFRPAAVAFWLLLLTLVTPALGRTILLVYDDSGSMSKDDQDSTTTRLWQFRCVGQGL